MQTIPIRGAEGVYAFVDDADFDRLNRHAWYLSAKGYAVRRELEGGRRLNIRMHREVLGFPEGGVVDHRNHNRLDNRRENLRVVGVQINAMHRSPDARSSHGMHVMLWGHRAGSPVYRVEITKDGKRHRGPKRLKVEDAQADARRMRAELGLPQPEGVRSATFGRDATHHAA